jgi:hypothetical protein
MIRSALDTAIEDGNCWKEADDLLRLVYAAIDSLVSVWPCDCEWCSGHCPSASYSLCVPRFLNRQRHPPSPAPVSCPRAEIEHHHCSPLKSNLHEGIQPCVVPNPANDPRPRALHRRAQADPREGHEGMVIRREPAAAAMGRCAGSGEARGEEVLKCHTDAAACSTCDLVRVRNRTRYTQHTTILSCT